MGRIPGVDRQFLLVPADDHHRYVRERGAALGLTTISYDPALFVRKAQGLRRERYAQPAELGTETLPGRPLAEVFQQHQLDHLIVVPVENLLVELATVREALRIHLEEEFDFTVPTDQLCGANFAIFARDLVVGLLKTHPDVMDLRGGLLWACQRPLYPFKSGTAPNPTRMPLVQADLRLVGRRQEDALATLGAEALAAPAFVYPDGGRLENMLATFFDAGPLVLGLEPTGVCAGKCIHCPHTVLSLQRGAVEVATVNRLAAELEPVDDLRVVFSGMGEPFDHPDFGALVSAFGRRHRHVITNAQKVPSGDVPQWLVDLDLLSVSVDAVDEPMFARMRPGLSWGKLQETVSTLISIKEALPRSFPEIGIRFMKANENDDQTFSYLNYWVQVSGQVHASLYMAPFPEPKIKPRVQWHQIIGNSTFLGQVPAGMPTKYTPLKRRPCVAALSRLQVLADGRIARCQFDAAGRHVTATAGSSPLAYWQSEAQRQFRRHHLSRAFAEAGTPCSGCEDWYHLWD